MHVIQFLKVWELEVTVVWVLGVFFPLVNNSPFSTPLKIYINFVSILNFMGLFYYAAFFFSPYPYRK